MATRSLSIDLTTLFTDKTTEDGDFNACTPWMDATAFRLVRMTFEVQNSTDASGVMSPGFQTANVEDSVLGTVIFPSGGSEPTRNDKTGDGVSYPNGLTRIEPNTAGVQLVRFGFFFKGSSAGLKAARVQGVLEYTDC